ncbi:uncharacterized protein FOMMEDRAFT_126887 [Fomitiporia mediterranea MF3/22]|uniref:uncharacterized protein n=1 Tax=Fomitiporia mediterranea (strain MF3/22) TaxID=694068 RepID=UPI0004407566|nr:uncharacterized protein FOMMEDRAFT_126887 [Fomitiporia mediterranea MF3/22]EJD01729.1 hypothetical protein FOMMEDRAFT_126887 [Fomitiporia mediterranea MF3/22]
MALAYEHDLEGPVLTTDSAGEDEVTTGSPPGLVESNVTHDGAFHRHFGMESHPSNGTHALAGLEGPAEHHEPTTVSHVAIDHFDPDGVNELKRTLTRQSANVGIAGPTQRACVRKQPSGITHSSSASTVVQETGGLYSEKFNFEQHLRDVVRQENEHGIQPRELGVVFQNLRVQGRGTTASFQPTVGSLLNPFLAAEKMRNLLHPPVRDIISGFEGVVNPGEMLLVLGRPGSGCSTLLKALSNQHDEYHNVSGLLHFSSFTPKQIRKHFRGDVIYCPEDDVHFPTLTVGETIGFAARTRMPNKATRLPGVSRREFADNVVEMLGTVFGLKHVKNTKVGNASIRGVSGGERKRVSIAEALATRAKLGAWDNSTRGLDSSTALEFVRALRIATDNLGLTSIVSIYQASELLYDLFDKVCVINEGRMVYFGPAREARQYFIDQGWEPANRQTTADFLVAVTDPGGRTAREGYELRIPRTADEMVAAFQHHPLAERNRREIAAFLASNVLLDSSDSGHETLDLKRFSSISPVSKEDKEIKRMSYIHSARAERAKFSLPESPYTISIASQVREVIIRRVQILRGDWFTQVLTVGSYVFEGIIIGTLFFKLEVSTSAYFSRGGVLFFAILFGAFSSMAEIPALYAQRPIVHRHEKAAMYHPFTEAIALTLVDIPISLFTLLLFSLVLYFLVRLQRSASQFFIFYLLVVIVTLTMKAFFRTLAAAFKRESGAQALAGVAMMALVLYTGYTIPKPSMIGALRWITYISPVRYGFEAILTNEFFTLNGTCATLVPSGPGYENVSLANQVCTTVGSIQGQQTVDGNRFVQLSYGYSRSKLWMNFGIEIAFYVGFLVFLLLFTELNTSSAADTAMTLFKRGAKALVGVEASGEPTDEEKGPARGPAAAKSENSWKVEITPESTPKMTDIFSWRNLQYTVPIGKGETRRLLDDVSGYVVPGKLTALMGESGAGKTTLLNVLAGRTDTGVILGDRFVNGQGLPHDFQAQTGYCQQMDTHLPEATVREALLFSAMLRQPRSIPLEEKEAYVDTCLKMCGLEAFADAIVGTLNVEFKKRTTIGVELAAKPKLLLFLDEPTSGLDSQSAWAIMAFLRNLADNGQAILCTIHQPSSELFQVFDRLLLLRKGGQMVYFGDLGDNCSTLIDYFERNGARKCGPQENPAEWMLDVIGAGATATTTIDWHEAWNNSVEAAKFKVHLEEMHEEGRKKPPVQATQKSEFATPWGYQLYVLLMRAFQAYWRNPTYIMAKQFLNIAAGLFLGFTFFKADDSIQGTQNKLFAIFMSTLLAVAHANTIQVAFIDFRNIYEVRERPSRMYSWTALVTTQLLVELPWNIFGSTLFFLCWYWTVGFESSRAGYTYLMFCVVFPLYYTTLAHAVAATAPNAVIGAVLFTALFSFVIAFNGVLQPFAQLGWWKWMYHLSPYTYLVEGLLGQAIGKMEINCSPIELVPISPPDGQTCAQYMNAFISFAGGYLTNPNATSSCQFCAFRTTDQFMAASFNMFYSHRWRDFGLLMTYIAFNTVMIYVFTYVFRIRSWR